MISGVFANSIDFDKVKVVNGRYLPFQANNVAMAPKSNLTLAIPIKAMSAINM